jgi:hypothetical protein
MAEMGDVFDGISPAGTNENGHGGQISDWKTIEMEHDFDDAELSLLDDAQINPIIYDTSGYGVMIEGDRTLQVANSDTSFIATRRIDNYIIERVVRQVMRPKEFKNNTKKVYEEILEFLGLVTDCRKKFPIYNKNSKLRSITLSKILKKLERSFLQRYSEILKSRIGIKHWHWLVCLTKANNKIMKREPMDKEFRQKLEKYFEEDQKLLERILNKRDYGE